MQNLATSLTDPRKIGFILAGFATATIYFLTLFLCVEFFKLHYNLSVFLAWLFSITFEFLANRFFVFRESATGNLGLQGLQFLLLSILRYLITLGTTNLTWWLNGEVYSGSLLGGFLSFLLTWLVLDRFLFSTNDQVKGGE